MHQRQVRHPRIFEHHKLALNWKKKKDTWYGGKGRIWMWDELEQGCDYE